MNNLPDSFVSPILLLIFCAILAIPVLCGLSFIYGLCSRTSRQASKYDVRWVVLTATCSGVLYWQYAEHDLLDSGLFNKVTILGLLIATTIVTTVIVTTFARKQVGIRYGYTCSGIAVMMFWLTVLQPEFFRARESAKSAQCKGNLKQLGLVMHNILDTNGDFPWPTDGTPERSWRVNILPWLDNQNLYDKYDQLSTWNSDNNLPIAKQSLYIYSCPSSPHPQNDSLKFTSYALPISEKGVFPPLDRKNEPSYERPSRTAHLALIVEACGENIIWTEPRDVVVQSNTNGVTVLNPRKPTADSGLSTWHPTGATIVTADGGLRRLSPKIAPEVLNSYFDNTASPPPDESF